MAMVGALSCISRNTMAFLALSLIRDTQSVSVVRRGYRASLHSPAGIWEDISIRNPEIAWTNGWSNSYTHNLTVSANIKWFVQFSLNIFLFYGLFKNSNNLEDEQKNYREKMFFLPASVKHQCKSERSLLILSDVAAFCRNYHIAAILALSTVSL